MPDPVQVVHEPVSLVFCVAIAQEKVLPLNDGLLQSATSELPDVTTFIFVPFPWLEIVMLLVYGVAPVLLLL